MTFNRAHLFRQVDLFTLKIFLSAVELRQIGRAALRENISPSTATQRIKDLEEIAGVELLERTPKGVVTTPAGEVVARYIRTIIGSLDDMRAEIAAFSEGVRGEITIASARSIIVPYLARELGEYSRDFPHVEIIVQELENARIIPAVVSGEADIGVFATVPGLDLSGVDVEPYRRDRMVAVVPVNHLLAERSSVSLLDLLPENIIPAKATLDGLTAAAKRLGVDYKARYAVKSGGVAISLVEAGLGVTVLPECLVEHEMFSRVAVVSMVEHWAIREVNIATLRGRLASPAASALLSHLVDQAGAGVHPS